MIQSQSYCFIVIITIYFFFCLLPLPNTFAASPTRSLCRRDQRDALLEVQKEFHVPTTSWDKSADCCSWDGVTCDDKLGEVISLKLYHSTANTFLKTSSGLFKLQHLRELYLKSCNLHGKIPSSIGNLSYLTHLDLSRNQLVGEIPTLIGNLNRLEFINLEKNHLSGNIPTSFSNLTKLYTMDLSENQFTGGDIVLSNLTSLTSIDLSCNLFHSLISADMSGLQNLESFRVYNNSFFGPFPSSFLMISSLVNIDLSQNQFEGHLDFGNTSSSSRLRVLDVGYNGFDGLIPESISKLVSLEELYLSHNSFLGRVPSSISKLANLSSLDLSYNNLEGQVPHYLWTSPKMCYVRLSHNSFNSFGESEEVVESLLSLDLGSNSLQGPFPQWICKLRDLEVLDLSNNQFTGSIPQCLKNLTSLRDLFLRNNSLSGFLPDIFTNSTSLQSFDVSRNNFVGKLPKSLINCELLKFLNVRGNKIKDTFPFWLGSLQGLKILLLKSNEFYGPIYNPSAYLRFQEIRIVDISNNNFVGSLPQDYFANWTETSSNMTYRSYGALERPSSAPHDSMELVYKGVDMNFAKIFNGLRIIDFSGNRFSGDIPGSIGLLIEFRHLNLSGNAFTGKIPPSLAYITKLESLDLSRNNLSGEIPQGLGKLSFLSNVNFSYNHLEGMVPRSTQFQRQDCSSFVGNPGLYGLDDICRESHHVPVPTSHQLEESLSEPEEPVLNWIAAAIAFGPGVFCGLVIGLIFTSYKHEWFILSRYKL